MSSYLTRNFNFCNQGEYQENSNVVVDNDTTVGIDCLTWLTSNARVKIYNKFVCQITSPGVNKTIGNNIINFINCPDKRLKETFASTLAKENGITRLEATIYNYTVGKSDKTTYNPLEDSKILLETSKHYFHDAPFYSVPISKMWTKITEALQNSCCLVFNNLLFYVYWGNRNTKKLTGVQMDLPDDHSTREKIINYCLSAFGFNCLPINFIEVVEDTANRDHVRFVQKCYLKAGNTYFSRSKSAFSNLAEEIDIQNTGLIATDNVVPSVLRKRTNTTNKLCPFAIKEMEPLSSIYTVCIRKRKAEMEDQDIKKRKIEYLNNATAIKEEYKHLLEKEERIRELRGRLENHFTLQWGNPEPYREYKVSAFIVNNKGTHTYVGVLVEKDGHKEVCFLKGRHKNIFITVSQNRDQLIKDGFVIIPYKDMDLVCLPTEEPFADIITNGFTTYQNHRFIKIDKFKLYTNIWKNLPFTQEDLDKVNSITMQNIKEPIKFRDCLRLEELAEGTELVITGLKSVTHREKQRYIIQFENSSVFYRSNYWLEKELQNMDLNYGIKIKLDKLRHTPNRSGEGLIFCL
uniref:Uncharacterized protein n=1 Tax=Cacopsylla melanoneura TaxID=428564 RepID=A0A8D9AI20_9HEMI